MFTKKLEDQFSADLLNTVKGVLGEAKHDKECECEKCEDDEDEDEKEDKKKEMKEGSVPTSDEPTEHDKKVAQKVRDLLAKEKKPMKEEKRGLWANIHAKRKRIKAGSGERMRKPGSEGAPTNADFKAASESVEVEEGLDKKHPIVKEYDSLKKHDIKTLRGMISRNSRVVDTSDFKTKDHAISHLLRQKHGHKKVDQAFGFNEEIEQIDELSNGTLGKYIYKAADRMSTQGVTAGLKIASDENSSKNFKNITKRQKGIATAVKKLTKEELENLDELSKGTLGNYIKQAKKDVRYAGKQYVRARQDDDENEKKYADKLADKRYKGINQAVDKLTKEEQEFIDALNNDTLEEGRGRPPKEGTPAWHAKQKQASDDMVALGMQLRKAKSMNKKVRFMDNKEHEVSAHHADRFEDHMAARKTSQDKAAFQKQAHKSHADFVKAVSAPVPKANKDTGEIVKYRH